MLISFGDGWGKWMVDIPLGVVSIHPLPIPRFSSSGYPVDVHPSTVAVAGFFPLRTPPPSREFSGWRGWLVDDPPSTVESGRSIPRPSRPAGPKCQLRERARGRKARSKHRLAPDVHISAREPSVLGRLPRSPVSGFRIMALGAPLATASWPDLILPGRGDRRALGVASAAGHGSYRPQAWAR